MEDVSDSDTESSIAEPSVASVPREASAISQPPQRAPGGQTCDPPVTSEEEALEVLQRSLTQQVEKARAAASAASMQATAAAACAAKNAAAARERRKRAMEAEMRAAVEAEERLARLSAEKTQLCEKITTASREINRLNNATASEEARTSQLRLERTAVEKEVDELSRKTRERVKEIKMSIRATLSEELEAEANAARGNTKAQVSELAKRLEELKVEASELRKCMDVERMSIRDEKKRHQAAIDLIRSRPQKGVQAGEQRRFSRSLVESSKSNASVWANSRLKEQRASLADAEQVRDTALGELKLAKENERRAAEALDEAMVKLGCAKELRVERRVQLEDLLEAARLSTENACGIIEESMKKQRQRFAGALMKCKGEGVSYAELMQRIKAECAKLRVAKYPEAKRSGEQIKVGGRAGEGSGNKKVCVICQDKGTSKPKLVSPGDGTKQLAAADLSAYSGVDDMMSVLTGRIGLWKVEVDLAREKSQLQELMETERTMKSEAAAAANKVEALARTLLKAQGEKTEAQASLERLHSGHNKSIGEVTDQAERSRSLQAQLRKEKDESNRWKAAADATENELRMRSEALENSETQLRLMERELENGMVDKTSKETALRSVNAQLAALQLEGAPRKVESTFNSGGHRIAELEAEVECTKLDVESINKELKRAKRRAATIKSQVISGKDTMGDNGGLLAEIEEHESLVEQLVARADEARWRKNAQEDARQEAELGAAEMSRRLVETNLELHALNENLLVMREQHAGLLRAKERRDKQRLAISETERFACSGR